MKFKVGDRVRVKPISELKKLFKKMQCQIVW